jgi:hypothetical protein
VTWFTSFSLAVYPYVSNTLFMGTLSGVIAPLLHSMLEANGLALTGKKAFWFNVALASTPYLVLVLMLGAKGMPAPDDFWKGIGAATAASQILYKGFMRKDASGTSSEIEIPGTEAPQNPAPDA